ncbi:MAG: 6-bladed beta-propeller [Bacteroidetes bacterium]|nr:6-bladed beta-propeller [Bacteroidota bacterium]
MTSRKHLPIVIRVLILIFILITTLSCNQKNTENNSSALIHIRLDPNNLPPLSTLSEIVKSVRIIPLETSPEILVGDVGRSFVGKDHIVFMSRGGTNYLYLFTKEGKFIRQIGSKGKGPGEYTRIRGISVLEDEQLIYVLDAFRQPFLGYSFDGEVAKSFKPPPYEQEMKLIDANTYAATCIVDHEVLIINTVKNDTLKFIPLDKDQRSMDPRFSGNQHSGIYYSGIGRDTVYRVSKDGLEPAIAFDFGEGHVTGDLIIGYPRLPTGVIYIPFGVYNCGDYYHVHIQHHVNVEYPEYHSLFINKENQELTYMPVFREADDILFCSSLFFESVSPEGELMTQVDAIDLIEALPKILRNKDFEYTDELINKIKILNEEDNPVIVLFKL